MCILQGGYDGRIRNPWRSVGSHQGKMQYESPICTCMTLSISLVLWQKYDGRELTRHFKATSWWRWASYKWLWINFCELVQLLKIKSTWVETRIIDAEAKYFFFVHLNFSQEILHVKVQMPWHHTGYLVIFQQKATEVRNQKGHLKKIEDLGAAMEERLILDNR